MEGEHRVVVLSTFGSVKGTMSQAAARPSINAQDSERDERRPRTAPGGPRRSSRPRTRRGRSSRPFRPDPGRTTTGLRTGLADTARPQTPIRSARQRRSPIQRRDGDDLDDRGQGPARISTGDQKRKKDDVRVGRDDAVEQRRVGDPDDRQTQSANCYDGRATETTRTKARPEDLLRKQRQRGEHRLPSAASPHS